MNFLAKLIFWINIPANVIGSFLFSPIRLMPGWLSNTLISAIVGVFLLVVFKYTSNQTAIGKARDGIKADMLSIKLFKDNLSVIFSAQASVIAGAVKLLFYSIVPMLIMSVPVVILLAQMGLWYQARPLMAGESAIVTLKLNGGGQSPLPDVAVQSIRGASIISGPVHIFSKNEILWKIQATADGNHSIVFDVGGRQIEKKLAVGKGFMRLSPMRPGWYWADILLYPAEKPFSPISPVESVSINYPKRISKTSGTDWWAVYFLIASMIFALLFKPLIKVRI